MIQLYKVAALLDLLPSPYDKQGTRKMCHMWHICPGQDKYYEEKETVRG